ncbi:MAG TPA: ZIP family metal transporter [Caulobacteraceae bacterium]|nr:ZIP family metal transporter [Caulobacteraceae bacterium]
MADLAHHASDLLLIALGLAAGLSTLAGGFLALRFAARIHLVLGFSAGAVLGVALLDLLPEAIELGRDRPGIGSLTAIVAAAFLAYMLADRAFLIAAGTRTGHRGHFGAGSLTAHSLLDGLGIGLGFQASAAVGAILAIAVLAHDLADGMNTVNLSLAGSRSPRTARRWLCADAVAPMVGIGVSRLIHVPPEALAAIIATFSGFFLYIGASELLPESHHRHPRAWTAAATVVGVVVIGVAVRLASG